MSRRSITVQPNARFGRFTIQEEVFGGSRRRFCCKCDCGVIKEVMLKHLISGKTKSCGCLRLENGHEQYKHIENYPRSVPKYEEIATRYSYTYNTYRSMKERCFRKGSNRYHRYGGRGIKICDRWLGDGGYKNFLEDMGKRPCKMTLDRIDPDGDYTPDNCRWATYKEQANNRSKAASGVCPVK